MLKVVFFYNLAESGWSETYYAPGSDPKLFAATLTPRFLANAVRFRSASCVLKAIRLTRVEPPRFSFLVRPYPPPQGQQTAAVAEGPDVSSTDAVILLTGQGSATRRVYMRGLADLDVRRDAFGVDLISPQLSQGIELFRTGMTSYGFTIRFLMRPPNGGLIWQACALVTQSLINPRWTKFRLTPSVPALAEQSKVSFSQIPSRLLPGWPRIATIIRVTGIAPDFDYHIAYALPGGVAVDPKGLRLTPVLYNHDPIAEQQFERFSEHKTGRPFGTLRGRARARTLSL